MKKRTRWLRKQLNRSTPSRKNSRYVNKYTRGVMMAYAIAVAKAVHLLDPIDQERERQQRLTDYAQGEQNPEEYKALMGIRSDHHEKFINLDLNKS